MICENDIKFEYPELDAIYYDIETFNTKDPSQVPKLTDFYSHIGIVCLVHVSKEFGVKILTIYNDKQIVDISTIKSQLLAHVENINTNVQWKPKTQNDISMEVFTGQTDLQISSIFFEYLIGLKRQTIVSGFHSNSGKMVDFNVNELGYDLPFLLHHSGRRYSCRTGRAQFLGKTVHVITGIDQIPNCIFADMQVLVFQ